MASLFERLSNLIVKNTQQTAKEYNQAIYNWLGESIVWNPENDDTYINEGYRKNATIYSIINIKLVRYIIFILRTILLS